MLRSVHSAGIVGTAGYMVTIESMVSGGLPSCDIVGLPDASVKEARDRVRGAIKHCGFDFPLGRITINLAPADTKKEGPIYDLPILLGILAAEGQINALPHDFVFVGELSLGGELRKVRGALSMALAAERAGFSTLFLPEENALEASFAENLVIYPLKNVTQLVRHLQGTELLSPFVRPVEDVMDDTPVADFSDVSGQENVKRALEIAVSGGHNILLSGSPGSGKSMMAKRISGILPPMSREERLEVIQVYSAIGLGSEAARFATRPFRHPHHTTSSVSLAGGGSGIPKPGEISLAHCGVLFLDELPEFHKNALEVLRQPLEDGSITVSRAAAKVQYPSRFMLVCAMNPCRCGWYGHSSGRCTCSPQAVKQYLSKLSGPLLDRIDLQVSVQPVEYTALKERKPAEASAAILKRVLKAREIQKKRFAGTAMRTNAYIEPASMKEFCPLDEGAEQLLAAAFASLGLTARSYDRILRVARTIADLEESPTLQAVHIAEAIGYRSLDLSV